MIRLLLFSPLQYCNKASVMYIEMQMSEYFWVKGIYALTCYRCNVVTEPYCSPKRLEQFYLHSSNDFWKCLFMLSSTSFICTHQNGANWCQVICISLIFTSSRLSAHFISSLGNCLITSLAYFSIYWVFFSQVYRDYYISFFQPATCLNFVYGIF